MEGNLMTIVGGIIILILLVIAIIIRMKNNPSIYDKEAATQFLEGLSNTFYTKMMDIINSIDFSLYNSLEEMETAILSDIYNTIWNYINDQLREASQKDLLSALALKVLSKDFIDKFIDRIIENADINEKIANAWTYHYIEKTNESVEFEDTSLQDKYASNDYYESFDEKKQLNPATEEEIPEEELNKLNPQKEIDEAEYDPENDDSVEIVEESEDQ